MDIRSIVYSTVHNKKKIIDQLKEKGNRLLHGVDTLARARKYLERWDENNDVTQYTVYFKNVSQRYIRICIEAGRRIEGNKEDIV